MVAWQVYLVWYTLDYYGNLGNIFWELFGKMFDSGLGKEILWSVTINVYG